MPLTWLMSGAHSVEFMPAFFILSVGIAAGLPGSLCFAQASDSSEPEFEVASIRIAEVPTDGRYAVASRFSADRFTGSYVTLRQCIATAYELPPSVPILGPDWIAKDRFTISAKSSAAEPEPKLKLMLQQLLAKRFRLRIHTENRAAPVYALVLDAKGLKIKPASDTSYTGEVGVRPTRNGMEVHHVGLSALAAALSNPAIQLDRPVIDMTQTDGTFEFTLHYATQASGFGARLDSNDDGPAVIFTTIREELGLRLEPRVAPIKHFVVDSALRVPTEN